MADTKNPQILAPLTDEQLQLCVIKSNVAGYFFDAVLKEDHKSELMITSHPVQTGANITDHAYVQPSVLNMQIGVSDVMESFIPGQFSESSSRSVSAYNVLLALQYARVPLQIWTRYRIYKNMLVESIEVPVDFTNAYNIKATVTFKEIFVVQVSEIKTSTRPKTTGKSNRGTQQPSELPTALQQLFSTWGLE